MSEVYTQVSLFAQTKQCPRCREYMPPDAFNKGSRHCRGCQKAIRVASYSGDRACVRCGIHKPAEAFNTGQPYCRECARVKRCEWTAAHHEHIRAYAKMRYATVDGEAIRARRSQWHAEHREHDAQYTKKWRQEHPDEARARNRINYFSHREARLAYMARYRVEHPVESLERAQRWREQHRDAYRRHRREYRSRYPEKHCEKERRRNARKRGNGYERVDYATIAMRDGMICYLCGKEIERSDLHYDHVIPLSKGGPHTKENIRVTHSWCNLSKGDKVLD